MTETKITEQIRELAEEALASLKAKEVTTIDVREKASFTDYIIVASGTSDRHLNAMANQVYLDAKKANIEGISMEGKDSKNWMLVDLGDVVVHLMNPETRATYEIEKLWQVTPSHRN